MAQIKMLRLIEIMQQERNRALRECTEADPTDEELLQAYDEVIQLLESFYTRSDQLVHNLRTYGRERPIK